MPKVRANVAVFVDNMYRYAGDVFEYNGPDDPNLIPLEGEAPKSGRRGKKDAASENAATD
jgi:hypothetical protein